MDNKALLLNFFSTHHRWKFSQIFWTRPNKALVQIEDKHSKLPVEVVMKLFNDRDSFRLEKSMLEILQPHPNVLQLHAILQEGKGPSSYPYGVVLTKYETTAESYANRNHSRFWETIARQLFQALSHCHNNHVIHRDVKLSNILCTRTNTDLNVVLSDFETAVISHSTEIVGTPGHRAPEMLMGMKYDSSVDIFGAGVALVNLSDNDWIKFKDESYDNDDDPDMSKCELERLDLIWYHGAAKKLILGFDKWIPDEFESLLEKLLQWQPKERASADQVLVNLSSYFMDLPKKMAEKYSQF